MVICRNIFRMVHILFIYLFIYCFTHHWFPSCFWLVCLCIYSLIYIPRTWLSFGAEYLAFQFTIQNININTYKILILPVILYGYETQSLTLRTERRMRVFENRVLRRIFGPKGDEVKREWTKLHNAELNYLYSLPNIVRVINRGEWDWLSM